MKRTFEIVEKGWEYRTEGYTIKKGYKRVSLTNTGYSTLNQHGYKQYWMVYPDDKIQPLHSFPTLKEVKQYIINKEDK